MARTMKPAAVDRPDSRVRVLFVAGTGRSGSTIVSNLLGSTPGMISLGEVRYLWERGLREASVCGCGARVPDCPFWHRVLKRAHPDAVIDFAAVRAAESELLRLRSLRRLTRVAAGTASSDTADRYRAELSKVYAAIGDETSGAVIVDSSKLPGYARLLSGVEGIDVTVLHLVRDPRGVAHSWGKHRTREDRGSAETAMGREGALRSAVLWDMTNAVIEQMWPTNTSRRIRVHYEEIVSDPVRALRPVLDLFGIEGEIPVADDGRVSLTTSHTVAGNPIRTSSGSISLRSDDEWLNAMPAGRRLLVTATTMRGLIRYGYPVRVTRESSSPRTGEVFIEDLHGMSAITARVRRNVRWLREQGPRRLREEKEIAPIDNTRAAVGKWSYRRRAATSPGDAVPVFVVGVQRSGTNMLMRGLGRAPETEVHNENDRKAFDRYKLRANTVIESIVAESRHSHVLFKPLCDSQRTDELLENLRTVRTPLAVWAYRDVEGRVQSALAKFGDTNLRVLREFADGTNTKRWHVQRISAETADFVRSFDYRAMNAATGAALMWLVRNQLYFDLALDRRKDTHLVSYDLFLDDPETTMVALCAFLGFPYRPSLISHVARRETTASAVLDIDPRVRSACDALAVRLADVASRASTVA